MKVRADHLVRGSSNYLHAKMEITQRHFILLALGVSIIAPKSGQAQFNEEQVAKHYAALRDSLATADSLLASGNCSSALAIYQTTTPWKHNAGFRYVQKLKCAIDHTEADRSMLDSLAHYDYDSTYVESDSLLKAYLGSLVRSGPYPPLYWSPLRLMIDSLGALDQDVRNLPSSAENDRLMALRDSMNIGLLYPAFREHGGYIPSIGSILTLIHVLGYHQEHLAYFAQSISDALFDQYMSNYTYGLIVDEFFWVTKNCQVFGTIGRPDDPDVPALRWCDPERTVRLRKLLGLPAATE